MFTCFSVSDGLQPCSTPDWSADSEWLQSPPLPETDEDGEVPGPGVHSSSPAALHQQRLHQQSLPPGPVHLQQGGLLNSYSACTTKAKIIPKEIYIMFNFKIINQNIVFYIFLLKHGNIPILNQISTVSEIVYNCTCGCSRLYMCVYMVVHVCTKT